MILKPHHKKLLDKLEEERLAVKQSKKKDKYVLVSCQDLRTLIRLIQSEVKRSNRNSWIEEYQREYFRVNGKPCTVKKKGNAWFHVQYRTTHRTYRKTKIIEMTEKLRLRPDFKRSRFETEPA